MTCSFGNDEVKTTAGLKAGNTEMFLSMTPLASWPEDSPGNKTLRKRCYPTFLRSVGKMQSQSGGERRQGSQHRFVPFAQPGPRVI